MSTPRFRRIRNRDDQDVETIENRRRTAPPPPNIVVPAADDPLTRLTQRAPLPEVDPRYRAMLDAQMRGGAPPQPQDRARVLPEADEGFYYDQGGLEAHYKAPDGASPARTPRAVRRAVQEARFERYRANIADAYWEDPKFLAELALLVLLFFGLIAFLYYAWKHPREGLGLIMGA